MARNRQMTAEARKTVAMIRGTLPTVSHSDVYVSSSGDALVWVNDGEVIHVSPAGSTSTLSGAWETGWEA